MDDALGETDYGERIRRWLQGYRMLSRGVPDAGVLLLYHQSALKRLPPIPPCVKTCVMTRHNDQWRIVGLLTILNILAVCARRRHVLRHRYGQTGRVCRLPH
ncbi:hypothetical protein KCP73_12965 [Salmonella enterica subsp. enterica]|nr:hypothetical protein KCP73_12965 [Salmonella enterica subsp. enterica]